MTYLRVRNWERFQHYKNRRPIWIKYHVSLLRDSEIQALPIPTRLLWDQLLLLAADYSNAIPNDSELIANLTGIPRELVHEGVVELEKGRWLSQTKTTRRASKVASAEKEKELDKDSPPYPLSNGKALQHLTEAKKALKIVV